MAKAPAFQLYAADFLVDTIDFTVEEVGIYCRLLFYQWVNGWLPADPKKLARVAMCEPDRLLVAWECLSKKFIAGEDGNLRNPRMEEERQKQESYRQKQASLSESAWERRKANGKPVATHEASQSVANALQSSSSSSYSNTKTIKPKPAFVVPDWIPPDSWNGWLEMRKRKGVPATERSMRLAVNKLAELRERGHPPDVVLDNCTLNGWQGIFEPRSNGNGGGDRRRSVGEEAADRVFGRDEKPLPQ